VRLVFGGDEPAATSVRASQQIGGPYQWRLLALTLPTITLFLSTAAAAMSAQAAEVTTPPWPTPVRQRSLAPIAEPNRNHLSHPGIDDGPGQADLLTDPV
jgi:hypothetical protein